MATMNSALSPIDGKTPGLGGEEVEVVSLSPSPSMGPVITCTSSKPGNSQEEGDIKSVCSLMSNSMNLKSSPTSPTYVGSPYLPGSPASMQDRGYGAEDNDDDDIRSTTSSFVAVELSSTCSFGSKGRDLKASFSGDSRGNTRKYNFSSPPLSPSSRYAADNVMYSPGNRGQVHSPATPTHAAIRSSSSAPSVPNLSYRSPSRTGLPAGHVRSLPRNLHSPRSPLASPAPLSPSLKSHQNNHDFSTFTAAAPSTSNLNNMDNPVTPRETFNHGKSSPPRPSVPASLKMPTSPRSPTATESHPHSPTSPKSPTTPKVSKLGQKLNSSLRSANTRILQKNNVRHQLLSRVPWDQLVTVSGTACDLIFNCRYSMKQVEDEVREEKLYHRYDSLGPTGTVLGEEEEEEFVGERFVSAEGYQWINAPPEQRGSPGTRQEFVGQDQVASDEVYFVAEGFPPCMEDQEEDEDLYEQNIVSEEQRAEGHWKKMNPSLDMMLYRKFYYDD